MNEFAELKTPTGEAKLVSANYNKLSDHIRRLTPQGIQCSVFCGGTNCKYENPENWTADNLALQGIYSHWITDNILAMARPSTVVIVKKNIIQQFESLGIKSIINLQCPKEHASCGQPLENSGFSYDPNIFMERNIFYYNFAWKDYGDATLVGLLNMVKVLAFAVSEGNVAVHCHAGLGRTGVLIACYLVYALRVTANDAIRYVRLKRPGSVQTRGQIICVRHFAQFILPRTISFYIRENSNKDKYMTEFTLHRFLKKQGIILHGYDSRNYKFIPKIVDKLCERLLKMCGCYIDETSLSNVAFTSDYVCGKLNPNMQRHESSYSICSSFSDSLLPNSDLLGSPSGSSSEILSIASSPASPNPSENGDQSDSFSELDTEELNEGSLSENKCFQELETQKSFNQEKSDFDDTIVDVREIAEALLIDEANLNAEIKKLSKQLQIDINHSQIGWKKLSMERNPLILSILLFDWLEGLKMPILNRESLETIVIFYNQPDVCLSKFDLESGYLIEYILRFLSKLEPLPKDLQGNILKRFVAALAKQTILIEDTFLPSGKGFRKFREGTLKCALIFFESLFTLVDANQRQKNVPNELNDSLKIQSEDDSDVESGFQ